MLPWRWRCRPCERPAGDAALTDLDGDGMHKLQVRGMCGAGPDCEDDVYRINPSTRKLYHMYERGSAQTWRRT